MANVPLPGYVTAFGGKKFSIVDHSGPSSYAAGGETINASDVGMGGLDRISASQYSMSGTYSVVVLYPALANAISVTSVKLAWYVVGTGAQVTNGTDLSAEHIRMEAWGV